MFSYLIQDVADSGKFMTNFLAPIIIIIIIIIMGAITSNDRLAATLCSLGTWFVSGIFL
jgi:hypothetical protein